MAAAVIALAVPVSVSTYMLSEETYERRSPRLGEDHLLIGTFSEVPQRPPPRRYRPISKRVSPRRRSCLWLRPSDHAELGVRPILSMRWRVTLSRGRRSWVGRCS